MPCMVPMGPKPKPPIERWLPKVVVTETCWRWTGSIDSTTGYGKFGYNRKTQPAHRFAYEHFRGTIPKGLVIDHVCRNRWCVNPAHLEPMTLMENLLKGDRSHLSYNALKTHCPKGHPLSGVNLWVNKRGGRHCRACNRESTRRYRARMRL